MLVKGHAVRDAKFAAKEVARQARWGARLDDCDGKTKIAVVMKLKREDDELCAQMDYTNGLKKARRAKAKAAKPVLAQMARNMYVWLKQLIDGRSVKKCRAD